MGKETVFYPTFTPPFLLTFKFIESWLTKTFRLLSLITAPVCARPVLLEMMLPELFSPQPQGQPRTNDPDHVRDLQRARHVREHPGRPFPVRFRPNHRLRARLW